MRIVKIPTLRGYWLKRADAKPGLEHWLRVAQAAQWHSLDDTRANFAHADEVKVGSGHTVTVFNIGGGKYRLIVSIKYRWGIVYIRDFMTHAEYDKDFWKARH
jgi:mRNA interferase HigB